ncbi:uncharacterized protein LOC144445000 [Glandiceps talaboti]
MISKRISSMKLAIQYTFIIFILIKKLNGGHTDDALQNSTQNTLTINTNESTATTDSERNVTVRTIRSTTSSTTSPPTTTSSVGIHTTYLEATTRPVIETSTFTTTSLTTNLVSTVAITTVRGVCGGEYDDLESGTFYSPGYPDNYPVKQYCVYTMTVEEDHVISFSFSTFDLRGYSCQYDNVTVRDGPDSSSPLVGVYCGGAGRQPPETIISRSNTLYLLFEACDQRPDNTSHQGFSAEYLAITSKPSLPTENPLDPPQTGQCGAVFEGRHHGGFGSPLFPYEVYHPNDYCIYHISIPDNYFIKMTFTAFELQSDSCMYDFVEVRDGGMDDHLLGQFCGSFNHGTGWPPPTVILSSTNIMSVYLHTDAHKEYPGFYATFDASAQSQMNMTVSSVCDETRSALTDRGGVLVSHDNFGELSYPNKDNECVMRLLGGPKNIEDKIYINFHGLDLYPPEETYQCRALKDDVIQIFEGGYPQRTICGTMVATFESSLKAIDIKFVTYHRPTRNPQINYKGFKAIYTIYYEESDPYAMCVNGDFKCENGWCIASWLECDGFEHCSDGSDENHCQTELNNGTFLGVITGLSIAIVFGVISYILLILVAKKKDHKCFGNRRPHRRNTASTNHSDCDTSLQMQQLPSLFPSLHEPPPSYDDIPFDQYYANAFHEGDNDIAPSSVTPPPAYTEEITLQQATGGRSYRENGLNLVQDQQLQGNSVRQSSVRPHMNEIIYPIELEIVTGNDEQFEHRDTLSRPVTLDEIRSPNGHVYVRPEIREIPPQDHIFTITIPHPQDIHRNEYTSDPRGLDNQAFELNEDNIRRPRFDDETET